MEPPATPINNESENKTIMSHVQDLNLDYFRSFEGIVNSILTGLLFIALICSGSQPWHTTIGSWFEAQGAFLFIHRILYFFIRIFKVDEKIKIINWRLSDSITTLILVVFYLFSTIALLTNTHGNAGYIVAAILGLVICFSSAALYNPVVVWKELKNRSANVATTNANPTEPQYQNRDTV
ncbi:hypothetical protein SNEBB_008392 [Seison nebaliae]|nr:hypothetical protein SNEBB_008392 [Seison nebaliae]